MSGYTYKPKHGLYAWFPLKLHDGESGFILTDDLGLNSSAGWCLLLVLAGPTMSQLELLFYLFGISVCQEPFLLFHQGMLI